MKALKAAFGVFTVFIITLFIGLNLLFAQVGADLEVMEGTLVYSAPSEPNFSVGDKIKIAVKVKNAGTKKLNPVDVEFWIDETVIGEVEVGALEPGEKKFAHMFWVADRAGQLTIYAVGDPRRLFDESDEGNNRVERTITIQGQ